MDKNPGYLPRFITGYQGPRSSSSRVFHSLVRGIGEAKSKYEEDKIIKADFDVLKEKLGQATSSKQMREYLVRLIYCEMLGVDASALHIHAINFAQQRNLRDKRVGYLALSLFLHDNHSLILLLINTLQRDLASTNILEVCYALTAVNKLINTEMIPTILQQVLRLLGSKRDIIRKKAVMALHTIYKKSPSMVPDIGQRAIKALTDLDFSVSAASLHILYDLIMVNPTPYKKLIPLFVALQTTIISKQLKHNQDFEFHKVTAPWSQIKILRILSVLGAYDLNASKEMYVVLSKTLAALNTSTLISFAVAYECTRTIASIYFDKELKKHVTKCVGLFLVNKSNDIKYLGINALSLLIDNNLSFAMEPSYQRIIINCLDDPDETLKRKTLDVLCRITNADNVESICDRLIKHLRNTVDTYFRTDLVARVTELAERYAPDNSWYILTMNEVLELGGELVREDMAHNLMRLIAEGNEDEEAEEELRRFAVLSYMDLLEKPVLPDILVQVICWILGEYSYVVEEIDQESVLEKLCNLMERNYSDPSTKRWIITSIGKLLSRANGQLENYVEKILQQVSRDGDVDMRQRCHEIDVLAKDLKTMHSVLPVDASCEDLEVDSSLSFLDDYVTKALQNGASPYKPEAERKKEQQRDEEIKPVDPTLKITPYQLPKRLAKQPTPTEITPEKVERSIAKTSKRKVLEEPTASRPLSGIKGPWGPKGYSQGGGSSGSGSVDSGSRSGSSSRSSGSEKPAVVKTKAESSPSPLVFAHDDQAKQSLVNEIFKGVGNQASLDKQNTRGKARGARSTPRRRNPEIRNFPDPDSAPAPPPRKYLEKNNREKNAVDLLLDLNESSKAEVASHWTHSNEAARNKGLETTKDPLMDYTADQLQNTHENTNVSSSEDAGSRLLSSSLNTKDISDVSNLLDEPSDQGITPQLKHEKEVTHSLLDQSNTAPLNPSESLLDADISEKPPSLDHEVSTVATLLIPDELQEFPFAPDKIELCCDANIRGILQKVYKPDELVLVIFLTNQSQGTLPITNVVTLLEHPSNLRALFDSTSDNRFVDEAIEPLSSVTHCIALKYKSPALHMALSGKVSYKDCTNTAKNLFISVALPIRDLVRPLVIATESFGNKWSDTPFEKRTSITSKVTDAETFLVQIKEGLGLRKVEIIGSKAIAAGTVLEGPVCLLHGMVNTDGTLDIRIKTNSQLLSDSLIKQCVAIFK